MFPSFEYRKWYQTDINNIEDIQKYFFDFKFNDNKCFRGMADYDFICISTFYRHYLEVTSDLEWEDFDMGVGGKVSLPKIDTEAYKNLSFSILDEFESNLIKFGSKKLSFNSLIYIAQHYGLPTNLIDFTVNPKIALYFACKDFPEKDANVYMYDIFHHIKNMISFFISSECPYFHTHSNGKLMTQNEIIEKYKKLLTFIDRNGPNIVTPEIRLEDINISKRILNQQGVFVYHNDDKPFDLLMFSASTETAFDKRRIYKINKKLKPIIIDILDKKYGINHEFIFPDIEDLNINIIDDAIKLTKKKFGIK